jgi:hypothetical protein
MKLTRELAHRHQDGLEVTLLWDTHSNEVSIELIDDRRDTAFAFVVDPSSALEAFYHPFAYAPVLAADPAPTPELVGRAQELTP